MASHTPPETTANRVNTPRSSAGSNDASPIVAHRRTRGSVPISGDLFNATANTDVIAFQTTVLFHDSESPLTLPQLQRRWKLSERRATAARKTLIDSGFWAQVDARQSDGTFARATVFSETRLNVDDLVEIALQYPPSSLLRCGGRDYLVGADGALTGRGEMSETATVSAAHAEAAKPQARSEQGKQGIHAGRTETADLQARSNTVDHGTEAAKPQARSEQDRSNAEAAKPQARSEQGKQGIHAGRTETADLQADACSSSSFQEDDEKEHACMDELITEFWKLISSTAAVVDPRGRSSVRTPVETALQTGWTPATLAEWARKQLANAQSRTTVRSPGGFVVSQLREIPAVAEATEPGKPKSDVPAWCGECGDPADPRREFKCHNNLRARVWPDGTPCSCRQTNSSAA